MGWETTGEVCEVVNMDLGSLAPEIGVLNIAERLRETIQARLDAGLSLRAAPSVGNHTWLVFIRRQWL